VLYQMCWARTPMLRRRQEDSCYGTRTLTDCFTETNSSITILPAGPVSGRRRQDGQGDRQQQLDNEEQGYGVCFLDSWFRALFEHLLTLPQLGLVFSHDSACTDILTHLSIAHRFWKEAIVYIVAMKIPSFMIATSTSHNLLPASSQHISL